MTANHRNPSWLEGSFFMSASANVDSTEIHRSVIGAGAQVGRNAHVINSILMPGARVGEDAVVRNAIVDEYAVVPDGDSVGLDRQADRCRHFVTDQGLVVVAAPQETGSGERQGTGSGIVLVADSDSDYLEWARFVLENEGHEVLTVQSAELLMAVVVRHRAKIRVAICGSLEHDTIRAASRLLVDNLQHALLILRDEPGQQADTIVPASSVFGLLTEPANPGQLVTMVDEALNRTRSRSAVS